MLVLKAIAGWLLILVCAILNGALREFALVPVFGASAGLTLSGMVLCAAILLVALLLVQWFGAQVLYRYIAIGLLWLCLTVLFEFGFGRAQGKSWAQLLAAYSFQGGNLWPVVLVFTAAAPALAARLRGALLKA